MATSRSGSKTGPTVPDKVAWKWGGRMAAVSAAMDAASSAPECSLRGHCSDERRETDLAHTAQRSSDQPLSITTGRGPTLRVGPPTRLTGFGPKNWCPK